LLKYIQSEEIDPHFLKAKEHAARAYPLVGRNEVGRCMEQHKPNLKQAIPSGKVVPTDPNNERKPAETHIVEQSKPSLDMAKLIAPATALHSTTQLIEEKSDISLDDLVGHISLMLPKFETHMETPTKKLTSWVRAQEEKSKKKGWKSITPNLTTETSSYPRLSTVSISPSTVLCTIEESEIEIANIESKCTADIVMAANKEVVDCNDDWFGYMYTEYETVDYSEAGQATEHDAAH
jgi:hypothetical protein